MESIADYFLFLWHASYRYTGTLNDNTILHLSPFMDRLLDGKFHEVEAEAAVVPFMIKEEQFNKVFVLVDGIYPSYSRFVRGIKVPATREERSIHLDRKEPGKMWRGLLVCSRTLGSFLTDPSCSMISQTSPTELFLVWSSTTSLFRTESHKRPLTLTTTATRDMILWWVLLICLIVKCSNRQIFKSCKMLLQEKEEQSLESTMPLLQCRQL
jgi:hypothetical protein